MSKSEIVKKSSSSIREKGQYAVAFSLIGVMLYAAGFPIFFLLFIGALGYFIWKIFSSEARSDVRRIFEFYLSANEILREDQRRWYGFEIQESISRGEKIVRSLSYSPPLVHYALGALYAKLGDNNAAVKHLSYIENGSCSEAGIVFPSSEFRDYVRVLRKIERSPAEAPQTSSAIRMLERGRKNKLATLLESCRSQLEAEHFAEEPEHQRRLDSVVENHEQKKTPVVEVVNVADKAELSINHEVAFSSDGSKINKGSTPRSDYNSNRKTISEVLHDIYDESIQ